MKIKTVGISNVLSVVPAAYQSLSPRKAGGTPSHCSSKPTSFLSLPSGVRVMSAQSNKSLLTFPVEITIDSMQGKN